MKAIVSLLVLFILALCVGSCDSVTDSKATGVAPPSLISPADGDSNVSRITAFSWTGTADKLQIDVNPSFPNPVRQYNVTGTAFQIPLSDILDGNQFYYWRAGISSGTNTYWSAKVFTFRTAP